MSVPYRVWEIQQRSNTGPPYDENELLSKVFAPTLQKTVKKYDIRYDPRTPSPSDDTLADRVWQAGWELFREVGLYNTDTPGPPVSVLCGEPHGPHLRWLVRRTALDIARRVWKSVTVHQE